MFFEIIVFFFSISIGSFSNNVISYFVSLNKFDIFRSTCFCGKHTLSFFELIPLFSFIKQKGKCKNCNETIPLRYFVIEIFSVFIGIAAYLNYGFTFDFFFFFLFSELLLIIGVIDYLIFIIPNKLLIIMLFFILTKLLLKNVMFVENIISSVSVLTIFIIVNLIYTKLKGNEALGYGDVKFIAVLFLIIDFPLNLLMLWFASFLGVVVFLLNKYWIRAEKYFAKLPFGMLLSISTIIVVLSEKILFNYFYSLF